MTALRAALLLLGSFILWGAYGCSESAPSLAGPPAPAPHPPTVSGLELSIASPIPLTSANAAGAAQLRAALRDVKEAIPGATFANLFVEEGATSTADWLALLDACQSEGFKAVIGFGTFAIPNEIQGYRPVLSNGTWETGSLGELVSCAECVGHPALYAILIIDEPWHGTKRPFYSTEDLKLLYAHLKSLAPAGTDPKLMLQFSREIWRKQVESPSPETYWDRGMADVVQISALEFQDRQYLFEQLDQNHYWSRKIVHDKTPEIPLWTSVQAFGSRYGPSAGYWFPRERDGFRDLFTLLTDILSPKYETEHPLTGVMLQKWDSEEVEKRDFAYTLGDAYLPAQPAEQAQAAGEALVAIREWIAALAEP